MVKLNTLFGAGFQIPYTDFILSLFGMYSADLGNVTYFSILGSPHYFRNGKSYKLPKVVNGDHGNLRAEPPSWSRAEPIMRGARGGDV